MNDPGIAKASEYLLKIEKAKAKQRQKEHGGTAPGKTKDTGGKITTSDKGKSRDKVAEQLGVSGKTCLKLADMHVCPSVYVEKSN